MINYIVSFIIISTLLMVGFLSTNISSYELIQEELNEKTTKLSQKIINDAKKSKASKDQQ